jgi:hypothetical protein
MQTNIQMQKDGWTSLNDFELMASRRVHMGRRQKICYAGNEESVCCMIVLTQPGH